ncbi:MAG: glycine zipper domain-containing protein [Phycisphaerales bacterium JB064]
MTEASIIKTNWRKGLAVMAALVPALLMGGCNNGVQGAFSGAALGSLAGLGVGSVTGDRSDAVTIGAILGGVGGAIIGDQNARASAYSVGGGHTTERIVERPVYVDREVYVSPQPVVIYQGSRHYGHSYYQPRYHHQRSYHHGHYRHQRYYDRCW